MVAEEARLGSMCAIRLEHGGALPAEWPPSVVWLRFIDDDGRAFPSEVVQPVSVDLKKLFSCPGDGVVLTIPAIIAGPRTRWSFWDSERGGRIVLHQERTEDDILTGMQLLLAWWCAQQEAVAASARATVTIGVVDGP